MDSPDNNQAVSNAQAPEVFANSLGQPIALGVRGSQQHFGLQPQLDQHLLYSDDGSLLGASLQQQQQQQQHQHHQQQHQQQTDFYFEDQHQYEPHVQSNHRTNPQTACKCVLLAPVT